MSAALASLREAIGGFLRGFLGIGAAPHLHADDSRPHAAIRTSPTPTTARAALAARAARRGTCC